MGFGQLTPLVLLIQPISAVTEHLWLREVDDETIYQDHGGADPFSATLGAYQDGKQLVGLSNQPLLHFMATYTPPAWSESNVQRIQLKAFLYTSRTFATIIWLVQCATAVTASAIFVWDYFSIGFATQDNWFWILLAMGFWFSCCPIVVFILLPFSRLGKYYKREKKLPSSPRSPKLSFVGSFRLTTAPSGGGSTHSNAPSPAIAEAGRGDWSSSSTSKPQFLQIPGDGHKTPVDPAYTASDATE